MDYINTNKQDLLTLVHAPIRWNLFESALTLHLFDHIQQWQSSKSIAKTLQLDASNCEIWLLGLTSLGLLEKSNNDYQVAVPYRDYLSSHHEESMTVLLSHLASLRHCSSSQLIALLQGNTTSIQQKRFFSEQHWSSTVNKLRAHHKCGATHFALAQLSQLACWHNATTLMDLGAGSEQLAIHITNIRPDIHVTAVDLPGCAEQIKQVLTAKQAQNVSVLAGNYNDINLPEQFDIIWASMSLYYANNLTELIKKIKKSLTTRGCFISCHEGLIHQRTQPEHHVVGRLLPAITGNNVSFSQGDIATVMLKAGFSQVISRTIETNTGPIDVDIGYV